jgi:hypothetical protein
MPFLVDVIVKEMLFQGNLKVDEQAWKKSLEMVFNL